MLIRSAKGGLVMQVMYYTDEVRDFGAIAKAEGERLSPAELELAAGLIEKLSADDFEPSIYRDEHRKRIRAMLDQKAQGQEITSAPRVSPRGRVIDLMDALKKSLVTSAPRAKATAQRKKAKQSASN